MKPQDFTLDFRSGVPVYIQLVEQVLDRLSGGRLKAGDQLPTVRQMAAELRVNFNTVARAYRMLDQAGLISTQRGRGTYILEPPGAENKDYLMRDALEIQVKHFLSLLARQGFQPAEVMDSVKNNIAAWTNGALQDESISEE